MQGLMMDYELTLRPFLERAYRLFPKRKISTKIGPNMHRYTYADLYGRVGQLANALARLGVKPGDRVASRVLPDAASKYRMSISGTNSWG